MTSSGGRYRYQDDQQTPDTHVAAFEFEGGKAATWEGLSCNKRECATGFVAFYGEEGALEIDGSGTFRIYDADDKLVREEKGTYRDADHAGNLLQAVRDNKPLNLNAEILEGHKSTLLCHLGNIACRTGQTLEIDPSNGHIVSNSAAQALWAREYRSGWIPKA